MLLISIAQKEAEERSLPLLNTNEAEWCAALREDHSSSGTRCEWPEFQTVAKC